MQGRFFKKKVLIIKLGYSETLVPEVSRTTSLGDVLRSTVLLSLFKDCDITWLVDAQAIPLLKGNPSITRIMPYDMTSVLQLRAERFDCIINLEKVAGVCAFSDSMQCKERFGFSYDPESGSIKACGGSLRALDIRKALNTRYWEEVLFEMLGGKWDGEVPTLGYRPRSKVEYDIGFNHHVGTKWPIKAWPADCWTTLSQLIGRRYSISWQKGLTSLEEYFEWINSCSLIVTNDSLGLHIGHSLGKSIVALFGPTPSSGVFIKKGVKLTPASRPDCMPCMSGACVKGITCMRDILPSEVFEAIGLVLEGQKA
jgi:heptosyltransferase-2